jgi:hypothetical protein
VPAAASELHSFGPRLHGEESGTKTGAKKKTGMKKAAKRELDTGTDKQYVRRAPGGQFKESDDVWRSLSADRRKKAKTKVKSGQGDKGIGRCFSFSPTSSAASDPS